MAVTDQDGKVKYSYHYTPYGELLEGEYSDTVPFLYNGQFGVTTDGNGLYYMRARYYNVDIKRFINQDVLTGTLERISSLNRYAYVEGNPVSFLDPFGLEKSDTAGLHDMATIVGLVACVISLVCPELGAVITVGANGFDIGLYLYDSYYDIKDGDLKGFLNDLKGIVIDLIGIITLGLSNGYFKAAENAAGYNGIMGGYEQQLSMLYDKWKQIDKNATRGGVLYQLYNFTKYLWKELNNE